KVSYHLGKLLEEIVMGRVPEQPTHEQQEESIRSRHLERSIEFGPGAPLDALHLGKLYNSGRDLGHLRMETNSRQNRENLWQCRRVALRRRATRPLETVLPEATANKSGSGDLHPAHVQEDQ